MKKLAIIICLLSIALFAAVSVVSAADTKEEYYEEIHDVLAKIQENLLKDDRAEAEKWMQELRLIVYRCARFLLDRKEYDARIMYVITYAARAFDDPAVLPNIIISRNYAALVLLGMLEKDIPDEYIPLMQHS